MKVRFDCPVCKRTLSAPAEFQGKLCQCPKCEAENVRVPYRPQENDAPPVVAPPPAERPAGAAGKEVSCIVIAATIVLLVIVVIELFVIGHWHFEANNQGFFALELAAVAVLFSAFLFGHFFAGLEKLMHPMGLTIAPPKHGHVGISGISMLHVFGAVVISLSIYVFFTQFVDLRSPQPPAESHLTALKPS